MNEKCESCGVPQDYHPPGGLECVENQLAQAEEREKVANECIRLLEAERNTEKARAEKVEQGLCGASNDLILLRERTEKVEFDCASLRLELQAEKHNHQKDNEHLLARAEKAEEENAEYKRHLGNALYQAKEVCPDYPWSASPTMSEIAWAVCSTLEGAGLACDDWAADAKRLRETLGHIIIEAEQAMSVVPGAADALAAKPKAPSEVEGEDKHDA